MLRKSLVVFVSALLCASAMMADSFTPAENTRAAVKAYVEHAAKYVAEHGPDCAAFKSKEWMAGDYYVFVTGPDNRLVCHPNSKMVGKPTSEIVDANGKAVGTALVDAAKKGGGWVEYVWPRPDSTKPVAKSSYSVEVKAPDGKTYYVGSGGYELK